MKVITRRMLQPRRERPYENPRNQSPIQALHLQLDKAGSHGVERGFRLFIDPCIDRIGEDLVI